MEIKTVKLPDTVVEKVKEALPHHIVRKISDSRIDAYKDYPTRREDRVMVLFGVSQAIIYRKSVGEKPSQDILLNVVEFTQNESYYRKNENSLSRKVIWKNEQSHIQISSYLINHFTDDTIEDIMKDYIKYTEVT